MLQSDNAIIGYLLCSNYQVLNLLGGLIGFKVPIIPQEHCNTKLSLKRKFPFSLISIDVRNHTGRQHHGLCVCWMNLVKVLLQKVSLSPLSNKNNFFDNRGVQLSQYVYVITVRNFVADGIGLLGGTINYFASYDSPPKVEALSSCHKI